MPWESRRGSVAAVQGLGTWARMSRVSASVQSACKSFRSASGSLARASASRMPARSVSAFQCWRVWAMNGAGLGRAGFEELRPGGQLGLQPAEGLAAELRPGGVVGRRVVLALPGGGQRRGAGGVVAVLGLAVVAELRVGLQGLGPEPGGGGVAFRVVAHLGQGQALGDVLGPVLPFEHGREPRGQRRPAARPRRPTAPRDSASRAACCPARAPCDTSRAPRRSRLDSGGASRGCSGPRRSRA